MEFLDVLRRYQHYDDATGQFVEYRSVRDYAARLNVDHSWLSRVLNGEVRPGRKVLAAFARRYPEAARRITLDALAR